MKRIYKYEIDPNVHGVAMPLGAELLHFHMQGEKACVWARVDLGNVTVTRGLVLVPTGAAVPDHAKYVGTVGPEDYRFVFHVFDTGETA